MPQEGTGGVCSRKAGPYVTVGLDWELDQLNHANFEVQESFHLPASLDSFLTLPRPGKTAVG